MLLLLTWRAVGVPNSILCPLCLSNSAATIYPNALPNPDPSHCHLSLKLLSSLLDGPQLLAVPPPGHTQQSQRASKKLFRDYETWLSLLVRRKSRIKSHRSRQGPAFPGLASSPHSLHSSRTTPAFRVLVSTELVSTLGPGTCCSLYLECSSPQAFTAERSP